MHKSTCEIPSMPCATDKAHNKILILSSFSAGREKTILDNPKLCQTSKREWSITILSYMLSCWPTKPFDSECGKERLYCPTHCLLEKEVVKGITSGQILFHFSLFCCLLTLKVFGYEGLFNNCTKPLWLSRELPSWEYGGM